MTLTNRFNLPEPLVRAIERHEHKGADYSASMLANSPRQVWLKKRHEHEAIEDASDRIWALLGTAFHSIVQSHDGKHDLTEQYLEEAVAGKKVSGTSDLYSEADCAVTDWKTTSAWTIVYGSRMAEWETQINTYAWLYRKAGFPVKALRIVAILRDWSASKYTPGGTYPPCQVVTIEIKLWTEAEQESYIRGRVELHEQYRDTADDALPFCTDDERWARDGKPPARCDHYCIALAFCNQRQAELKAAAAAPPPAPKPRARAGKGVKS